MKRVPACATRAVLGLLVTGCTQSPETADEPEVSQFHWAQLTDPLGWVLADEEEDPMPEHRPDVFVCSPHPWHPVGHGIEADTGQCNYVTLSAPLIGGFEVGDPIAVHTWWSTLAATDPAQGHLALFVGGQLLWETNVAIPGPADSQRFEFDAPFSARADEDVIFHLHNHGFNTWTLAEFAVLRPHDENP